MEKHVYTDIYNLENRHWWFRGRRRIVINLLKKALGNKTDLVILDAGCGTGGTIPALQQFGTVHGIDPSEEAIKFCQQKHLSNVKKGFLENLPYSSDTFDVVIATDVLEHIEDDAKALKEIERVTKPGGVILLTVPAFQWLWSNHDRVHHHFRRYSRTELQTKLEQARLTIKKLSYYNFFLFPFALLRPVVNNDKVRNRFAGSPIAPLNAALYRILAAEGALLPSLSFPYGLSLIALSRKLGK